MGRDNRRPQPGDLIEIDRQLHQHWALYVGDGYIIHLTPVGKQNLKLGVHDVPVFTRKVKMQLLKEVVGKDRWRVNNESDENHTPLPVEEIIRHTEGYIGKEMKYRGFGSNCEHFVKKLRYGAQLRDFIDGEVHIPDMTNDKDYPKPGDLIEIKRECDEYWALYVGDGYVIHVTTIDDNGAPSLSDSSETTGIRRAKVKKQLLWELAGNDDWDVNNKYDCHRTPLPVREIIRRAEWWIGFTMPCDVLGSNSEYFVRKLRYGGRLRAFVGDEVLIPDITNDKDYPKPGDLIEIKRECDEYWALYVGDGYVIHVTTIDDNGAPSLSDSSETTGIRRAKVKKQLLWELAGNDDWDVNNKYDCHRTPLRVREIIQRAEQWIDCIVPCDVLGSNSEYFVRKLRYGGQLGVFVGSEDHILYDREDKDYPKPGDLIEISRGHYQHWALYVGDGYVIHVTTIDDNSSPMLAGSESLLISKAKVKKQLLVKVAGNDKWRVNNKYDRYRIPFPAEEIIRRAERRIGSIVLYRLLLKNCEHFVTLLRYGQAVSEQAKTALERGHLITTAVTLLGGIVYALPAVPVLLVADVGLVGLSAVSIGLGSSNIVHCVTFDKFRRSERDILEQKCC